MIDSVALSAGQGNNSADMQSREFSWSDADFDRVQKLIYQHAGISLHNGKHAMVYSRLSRRLRETGHRSFNEYLSWLESSEGPEWQEFINALTTNLTSFFRENHHFKIFHDHLTANRQISKWRVWCCAASTGEEPYSILMTATNALGAHPNLSLVASDIDSKVLAAAAAGVYRVENLKNISDAQFKEFFLRGKGANAGMVRVKPDLQKLVEFRIVNLVRDSWPIQDLFEVVFCRNVMIYFDGPTQRKVLERIHRVMSPGGLLFVGHAENFSESRDLFVLKGKTVYART
ncbi:CheR family methyltransferase [Rhodoferax antarcticus]|uniref:CheR family methyltransferase n=1 Tax=Rhodoferax antarcticus TaxID=81479 RepID=UPI002224187E|nr:CheR family methyltransferase [Rhodoferax antarcticus]MCW2312764.1 chemotaxis protein methyltransferase CheR [Rhodoferax antarcticus]